MSDFIISISFSPEIFVELFLTLKGDDKRLVAYAIENRYQFSGINQSLIEECKWLKSIHALFIEKKQQSKGKLSGYTLQDLIIEPIEKAISKLEGRQRGSTISPSIGGDGSGF